MITATGGNSGIYCDSIAIFGGTVNATGTYGIYDGSTMDVFGGTTTVSGGTSTVYTAPSLSNGEAVTVASVNLDGSIPVPYVAAYYNSCKYLKIGVPSNSTISPTTASFDKYSGSVNCKDIETTLTLNGNTLSGIWNGTTQLVQNTDYTVSGTTVKILKAYLTSQSVGATTLTFKFSAGSDQTLTVTVSDTMPSPTVVGGSGGSSTPKVTTTTAGTGTAALTTVRTQVVGTISAGSQTVTVPKDTATGLTDAAEKAERTGGIAIASIDTGAAAGLSQVGVTIPGASFDEFAAVTKAALQINTGLGSVTFSSDAVDKIGAAGSGDVTFGIGIVENKGLSAATQKLVGSRPVYRFFVTVGDLKVSEFGSSVTVTLPYTLGAKEDPNAIVVYYIDASGALKTMQGKYDVKTGSVTFKTTHFSEYMIGYNKADFTDVSSSAWYADALTFLAARGITSGTSDGVFSPDAALTRGQFIVMLLRAYGMSADTNPADNFTDAGNTYYTGYIAAAKRLGIANGVGDNRFAPEKAITRQEVFTLLYNALKTMGQLPSTDSGKKLAEFSDAGQMEKWAAGAIESLVKAGIVSGNGGNLAPMSMTTRAEMAQVLYNILKQ